MAPNNVRVKMGGWSREAAAGEIWVGESLRG